MVKIESIEQASKLVFSYMKPGVLTNHVMTAGEYRDDIGRGVLFAHTWPGGVLFLRGREGCHQLSYYINDTSIFPACTVPDNTFIDIVCKRKRADDADKALQFWVQAGFTHAFDRIRFTRPGGIGKLCGNESVSLAGTNDIDECYRLIHDSFDRVTGYLPNYQELQESISEGNVFCLNGPNGEIHGLLRCINKAASVEIRQLVICEEKRGLGLARLLLSAFIAKYGDRKCTVWTLDGWHTPSIKTYTAAGFEWDGWFSYVLKAI